MIEQFLAWVRAQSGTAQLRALLVFDELYGFIPPHPANPPTTRPLVQLIKHGRAFGVGAVLATQDPMARRGAASEACYDRAMFSSRSFLILCCAHLAACGGQVSTSNDQAGNPPADASTEETGGAGPSCTCPAGQAWRNHACLSTLDIGCGQPCTAGVTQCGQYETCEKCAASSSCGTHDCLATCTPTGLHMGPLLPDSLRVVPTSGSAGASTEVTVYGFAWYIGALGYGVRVGSETIVEFGGGNDCAFKFKVPARAPGRTPIFVSQYGASDSWVLAGFFTYSAGDIDECVQPGYPCAAAAECCTTSDAPVSCSSGRCRAK